MAVNVDATMNSDIVLAENGMRHSKTPVDPQLHELAGLIRASHGVPSVAIVPPKYNTAVADTSLTAVPGSIGSIQDNMQTAKMKMPLSGSSRPV
jgi:ribonuclease HIII